ncbi:MAG: hypothetical protein QNL91_15580 [Candidatus Krumholzibacteria bacterium]|nr:hypothetical protein [Candidatus Krumholzibacteria bacterium]
MSNPTFTRRTVTILASVCAVSLLVGLALAIFQDELGVVSSAGNNSFSYSALGHHGFKTLLEEQGHPIITSRNNSGLKTGTDGILILAEPDLATQKRQSRDQFLEMIEFGYTTLVVLPKRVGISDPARSTFVGAVANLPQQNIQLILEALGIESELTWAKHSRDLAWDSGIWSDRPFIEQVQLVNADNLEPLIACPQGTLLGHLQMTETTADENWFFGDILVLTDPDLLANHGLRKGHNAVLATKIIDYLTARHNVVVFDETLHGFEVSPSVFRSFFRLPLIFVLLQVLFTMGAFIWLANGRFGSLRKAPTTRGRGLDFLIDNTAELLEYGGHGPFVLGRYHRAATAAVCRRLHLELPRTSPAARSRLANISQTRSPDFPYKRMESEVPAAALDKSTKPQEVLTLARAIHRWQQEMTHGL